MCYAIETFAEGLKNKLKDLHQKQPAEVQPQKPSYKTINYLHMDDTSLNVGRPIRAKLAFEIVFNNQIKVEYLECKNINDNATSTGDGTHLFDIFTEEFDRPFQVSSQELLSQFQEEVLNHCEAVSSDIHVIKLIGFTKHHQGVQVAMEYRSEGLLIDLIPTICLSNVYSKTSLETRWFEHLPNYQTERYMELKGYISSWTDLYLLAGYDRLPGAWIITSFQRDREILELLPHEAREAIGIATYFLRMFIIGSSQEIDPSDAMFYQASKVKVIIKKKKHINLKYKNSYIEPLFVHFFYIFVGTNDR